MSTNDTALRLVYKFEVEGFLQDHRFAQNQWCSQASAELRRLVAEVEALRADAERYRWLRDVPSSDWAICEWDDLNHCYVREGRKPDVVDAAIDAARGKVNAAIKREPLIADQICDAWEFITGHQIQFGPTTECRPMFISTDEVIEFARAIEAAHGITGETK